MGATATSLLLVDRYEDAVQATHRVIETVYRPRTRRVGDLPTDYARSLLILALAEAGAGRPAEASAAGTAALRCGHPVWPTMVLAGKLDGALADTFPEAETSSPLISGVPATGDSAHPYPSSPASDTYP